MKALLIEDDVSLGSSLQEALNKPGYGTTWVRRADDAKRFLAADDFGLILLDIVLPSRVSRQATARHSRPGDTPTTALEDTFHPTDHHADQD